MKKLESLKYKQLNLLTRTKLQTYIESGFKASEISKQMNLSRQTVYREIHNNSSIVPAKHPWDLKPHCVNYRECFKDVPSKMRHCPIKCPKYESKICDKLKSFPFVCNKCNKKGFCTMEKRFYYSDNANATTFSRLSESRKGIRMNKKDFDLIDKTVYEGIKKGQSIEHIIYSNPQINISASQVRYWINHGYMKTKRLDLRLANKYRTKNYEKREKVIKGKNPKLEHRYEDFLLYIQEHKGQLITEVDTVDGKSGDHKCLLTIHIKKYHFQFAYLLNSKTIESVNTAFYDLINKVGKELFQKIFGLILTDNGKEFNKLRNIEVDSNGEILTQVFFCHPYSSQEKGACENNHRLIRYIKEKGVSLDNLTQAQVDLMFSNINSLARTSLSGFTPYEEISKDFPTLPHILGISKINPNEVTLNKSLFD